MRRHSVLRRRRLIHRRRHRSWPHKIVESSSVARRLRLAVSSIWRSAVEIPENNPPLLEESRTLIDFDLFVVADGFLEEIGGLFGLHVNEILVDVDDELLFCVKVACEMLIFSLHNDAYLVGLY